MIAVVIPALDEAESIAESVESAIAPNVEVVVVDGGSADDTCARARAAGARVVESAPGRGCQLQAGVEATVGDPVVLLHADTRLPQGWEVAVDSALQRPGAVGGAFRFRFDTRRLMLALVELGVRARVALFSLPYGDQAIFVRRGVLEAIGGVPNVPIMEDLDLVRAMKGEGEVVGVALPALTSSRRYLEQGLIRTLVRHWMAVAGWAAGVDRDRVARWVRE